MPVTLRIPTPLQTLTQNQMEVSLSGESVRVLLENLEKRHPGFREKLFDSKGNLRRFVNLFVNGEDIRFMAGLETKVPDGSEVSIVPAIAGGSYKDASRRSCHKVTACREVLARSGNSSGSHP